MMFLLNPQLELWGLPAMFDYGIELPHDAIVASLYIYKDIYV